MRFLSLCSGIEAASVAWLPLGWCCAAVAEVEPFPCAVLKHHYPDVLNLGDVNGITETQIKKLGQVDVVVFGFPCTDLSVAGQRKGLKHADGTFTRSGLFFQCARIADQSGARWTIAENVPGLFSSGQGRDFATVVGELAGAEISVPGDGWRNSGVSLGPKGLVEWCVLDAQYDNLAQRRERVFIVRDSGNWSDRPPLFLKPESCAWHTAPRRETREGDSHDLAPCVGASGRGFDRTGDTRGQDCVIPIQEIGQRQSGTPMNGVGHGKPSDPMYTLQAGSIHGVAYTLRAEGFDASEDGTGRETPLVAGTLNCNHRAAGSATNQDARSNLLIPVGIDGSETGFALRSNPSHSGDKGDGGVNTTMVALHYAHEYRQDSIYGTEGAANALAASRTRTMQSHLVGMAVRRLTTTECARLQGFPDDYLNIEYRGRPACDGPKYRALGNSFAVPVVRWIGRRIEQLHNLKP